MPRVLHIIDSLDYHGAASQLLVLAKGLAQRGFDVHVCALDQHAPRLAEFAAAGIEATVVARRGAIDPLADWRLVRYVRRWKPDIVHTWNTIAGMFGPIAAGRPFIAGTYRIDRWRSAWERIVERRFLPRAARWVTDSDAVRNWYAQRSKSAQVIITASGVESARASDMSRESLLAQLGLPADARLIGVVGQLVPTKRVKDLIWAADLLRVLHNNLRVLIIGDGPLRAQLEEYARLASDLDHIRFLGAGNDGWRIMPHFDVLWNGSENEAHSSAILEAMAAGVPVVASDTPTNRELVVENETGYLIPLGARAGRAARARLTDRIFTDKELALRLATAARERAAQRFSAEQMLDNYQRLYDLR